jgi:CelD/BcsL family acetyltransferase involved in cellulose biosynthesis
MASRVSELEARPETGPGVFRVIETDPGRDPRWEPFLLEHPEASIYHHPAWFEALEREYGQKGVYFACENADHELLAIFPLMYTRGFPFNLGGSLIGCRLSSLPRTPVAGPVSVDSRATAVLLHEAIQRVSRENGTRLQIKAQGRELENMAAGLICTPWRSSYVLHLPGASTGPFRIANSEARASVKRAVNKATRSGVCTRPADTNTDLQEWYRLYLETMRRNAIPPRPYRFFHALWELMRPKGMMQLLLAEEHTRKQPRIVAGSIFLMFGKTVSYAFNGSRFQDLSLRPNDLIHWQAINDACANGFHFFDFGEVPEGNTDLAKFKMKWGAEPRRLYRYYYPEDGDGKGTSIESGSRWHSMAEAVWGRLPLALTAWLGERLYSYL